MFSSLVAIYSARFKLNEPKRRCRLLTLYLVFGLELCCSDGFTLNEPKRECEYQSLVLVTVRNEVAKVMFLHLSAILFGGGGVCLSACWDATPRDQAAPPGPCTTTPQDQAHPPPETATAADGTPTGMHSC